MVFPVIVTKGKEKEKVFHAPDLAAWLGAGWKLEDNSSEETPAKAKEEKSLLG